MDTLNGLDLFSGIGGITVALKEWVTPIAYCDNDRYAQAVLLSRMADGSLPRAPIWDDVKTLKGEMFDMPVDIIYGGFPCQDISYAGKRAGLEGERSGLFFEIARLVGELRPRFVFLENVPGVVSGGLDRVIGILTELRYDCRWGLLSAYDMGAPHKRERWFLLGHACGNGHIVGKDSGADNQVHERGGDDKENAQQQFKGAGLLRGYVPHTESQGAGENDSGIRSGVSGVGGGETADVADSGGDSEGRNIEQSASRTDGDIEHNGGEVRHDLGDCCEDMADSMCEGLEGRQHGRCGEQTVSSFGHTGWTISDEWLPEPTVGRVVNGLPFRVDRLKCLGNSVVPKQVREAFKRLMGL